ncbi:MAG: metal ABC transporter ATP-binding protein [Candidatus Liptonbacteria bacterium]|nr:metal ABC transporter ATP-binding protein [Candidatus Liptonbacteria bacterium]
MSSILSVKNLTVSFGDKRVLQDLSFELKQGENLTIIGPNGSGKTVLLKALLNALHYHGEIRWAEGVKLGYVPQKIEADIHLPLTIKDLLTAKARVMNLKRNAIETVAESVDLSPEVLKTPIGHLSGGQFQKTLIAFALLGEPNVILFDEPTASLDLPREEQVYELIHRLQEKYGLTVILVSHDLSLVYRYASKVLCLNRRGLCFGAPSEVLTLKVLQELYGREHKYYKHDH